MTALARTVEVTSPLGLHARPAAEFAETAARYDAAITVGKGGRTADARSVLLLLTLDVRAGDRITITADGPDAPTALDVLTKLVGER